jgi:hypothetical protein
VLTSGSSKRVGIDKALYQVEQAVKRSGSDGGRPEDVKVVARLRELLDELNASEQLTGLNDYSRNSTGRPAAQTGGFYGSGGPDAQSENLSDSEGGMDEEEEEDASNIDSTPGLTQANEETLAIDDAENPLQLLARASYFQPPEEPKHPSPRFPVPIERGATRAGTKSSSSKELHDFFAPAHVNLDVGDDIDPISLGLVSMEEAEAAFALCVTYCIRHSLTWLTML